MTILKILRFERRFQADVATGRKPFTVRKKGANFALGDRLELAPPKGAGFAQAVCVFRATLAFDAKGVRRLLNARFIGEGEGLRRLFEQAENAMPQAAAYRDRIATLDGFADWTTFAAYHLTEGQIAQGAAVHREVIGWADVVEAGEESAGLEEGRPAGPLSQLCDREWQSILDKDDRNSPAEYPEMVLIDRVEFGSAMCEAYLLGREARAQ